MIHMIVINAHKGHGYIEYIPKGLNPHDYEEAVKALEMRFRLGSSLPCWHPERVALGINYADWMRYE